MLTPFAFLLGKCRKFLLGFDRCQTHNLQSFSLSHISIPTFLCVAVNILLINSHKIMGLWLNLLSFSVKMRSGSEFCGGCSHTP